MNTEEWLPVRGYAGLYEVSSIGRVRSLDRVVEMRNGFTKRVKGRTMILDLGADGTWKVRLSKKGKVRTHTIARLVATAFMPRQGVKGFVVRKWEGDGNHAGNLEWVMRSRMLGRINKARTKQVSA